MILKRTKLCALTMALTLPFLSFAQDQTPIESALRHVEQKAPQWGLNETDTKNMLVSDMYQTKHNGVTHIYFQQSVDNIPVYNAIIGVHVDKNGKAHTLGHRFVDNLHQKITSSSKAITPADAVLSAAKHIGIEAASVKTKSQTEDVDANIFLGSNISRSDITVKPMYVVSNGKVRLSFDLSIDDLRNSDYWNIRVDAATGEVLDKNNYTTYCTFDHDHSGHCGAAKKERIASFQPVEDAVSAAASGSYRVFELPAESPNHGPHTLVTNPHIVEASPFGWHDIDGDGTPEYTITRGNNAHAYPDLNDLDRSSGNEPDGGAGLLFDYPYSPDAEPIEQLETAVVNLFYMSNMIHDISYLFGFDEAAGNFQENNFGNGGAGGDYVLSEAQDGSGLNNANFATPPDGGNGRMQMYVWNSGGEVFNVTEPPIIAKGYESGDADFGPNIIAENVDVKGQIVNAFDDDPNNPEFCCETIINPDVVNGKIAMIDRGGCFFDLKVTNAERAGAIAVIICNFDRSPAGMAASGTLPDPGIPSIMLGSADCATIRTYINEGVVGHIKAPEGSLVDLDGDYDNGIIAHEYGHGISNRLTGGPNLAGCLGNAEQMGEGWSDFFSLVTTAQAGDTGEKPRGVGTFAQRLPVDGGGIRVRPYTTDITVNDLTYDDVENGALISQPHGIGTVWCSMLWDMYWALADVYGYDPDFSNKSAGNNIAIQLVMDGMKLQSCQPGFVDGRDAILLADSINYDAANACLIWEVFARRGLGYYADQGSSNDRFDQVSNYEVAPLCQNSIRFHKTGPNLVEPGDTITYTLIVENNKAVATNGVVLTDLIPDNCEYIAGSASMTPQINGNELSWDFGTMASLQSEVIVYDVIASPSHASTTVWLDDLESGEDNWLPDFTEGFTPWIHQDLFANSGSFAFYTENGRDESDQFLFQLDPVTLDVDNPGIRFFHNYSTELTPDNIDGGIIEFSKDNGDSWQYMKPEGILRNGYNTALDYNTFTLPNLNGFAGNSNGFIDTYVDLASYKNEDTHVRFRFGTEQDGTEYDNLPLPAGWVVDDIEYLDLYFYSTDACVVSSDGDDVCARLPGKGTLVEPKLGVNSEDEPDFVEKAFVYPSPATDVVKLRMLSNSSERATLAIVSEAGQVIEQMQINIQEGVQVIEMNVANIPSGQYFLNVQAESGQFSRAFSKF